MVNTLDIPGQNCTNENEINQVFIFLYNVLLTVFIIMHQNKN